MGGFGSGRSGWRPKAEHNRSIDANRMSREGCFRSGYWGAWIWKRDGREVARIGAHSDGASLTLTYRYRWTCEREWHDVEQRIPIERVPCRFGGTRAYFICQGVVNGRHCGRRAVKLFGAGRYFLCRHCYRISYASQSESELDRLYRRANKLRERLGGEPGICNPLPRKPKGMWHSTYERRLGEVIAADDRADRQFTITVGAWLDRRDPLWREWYR